MNNDDLVGRVLRMRNRAVAVSAVNLVLFLGVEGLFVSDWAWRSQRGGALFAGGIMVLLNFYTYIAVGWYARQATRTVTKRRKLSGNDTEM